jgi:protein-tyrosine phosphatase
VAGDPNDGAAWQRLAATTFASLDNFRDVGGAAVVDGRHVRTGRLFRSDTLTKLSGSDVDAFDRLGIRTVIDLRRPTEVEEFGRIADAVDRRYINISPQHRLWDGTPYDEIAGPSRFLADRYHELTHEGAADIGEVIATLAEATTESTLVHCFAGKDRTGVVIALTLAIVGVGVDAIADDYALSNDWAERFVGHDDLARHWIFAPREAMTVFLAELVDAYGSVEGYLATTGVGLKEFDALRDNLLV